MFSTSMMASSTTTPTAITSPASTIVLIVPPVQYSTRAAAISDNGIAVTLTRAVRHWNRKTLSTKDVKKAAQQQREAQVAERLLDEPRRAGTGWCSTAVPVRVPAGSPLERFLDPAGDFEGVAPTAAFRRSASGPGPPLITASPISCWWSSTTVATSASFRGRQSLRVPPVAPGNVRRRTLMGCTCLMDYAAGWVFPAPLRCRSRHRAST